MARNKAPPQQLSLGDLFLAAEFDERTAHLPSSIEIAVPHFSQLLENHHAAILAGDVHLAARLRQEGEDLAVRLNGGRFGFLADEDSPGVVLERETAAPIGTFPLWGQAGDFEIAISGIRIRIEFASIFGVSFPSFSAHVVDPEKPFISETGYRSFLGCQLDPNRTGVTPDVFARESIEEHVRKELKGKLVPIEPRDRGPPPPVSPPPLPIAEPVAPTPRRRSPSTNLTAEFIKKLSHLDPHTSAYEKFRDFCEMAFCALAKRSAPTASRAQALEDRYMQIVGTYRDKDTVRAYAELLATAASAIGPGGIDFFGKVASEMEVLSAQAGQLFTPYEIARLMAAMMMEDVSAKIEEKGFVTLHEPACGAGGMILAAADTLESLGFDPSMQMLVHAIDVAPLCYHMTYVQLTLRGIPAHVQHGNTLTLERFDDAWTAATGPFYARHGRLFDQRSPSGQPPTASQLDLL